VESGDRRTPEASGESHGAAIATEVKVFFGALLLLLIGALMGLQFFSARLPAALQGAR
jgi:hypothetical protein